MLACATWNVLVGCAPMTFGVNAPRLRLIIDTRCRSNSRHSQRREPRGMDYPRHSEAADAWSQFKRVRCGGLSPATVQRFRATFSAAINYLAAEVGFDAPKLPRGEKVSNKRVRYLTDERVDRLVAAYASHAQPIAIILHSSLAGPSHRRSIARRLDAR